MKIYEIRPHHGLCLSFFGGKGYSSEFVKHMAEIKAEVSKNPTVLLHSRTDEICSVCPHNKNGTCESEEKVQRYDKEVLRLCSLDQKAEIEWKLFEQLLNENILVAGKREAVCGDCEWNAICK
ncbi:hypothetical protein EDD76_11925 [Kineothrix alysoides]|uniref:DUF1284 domain-containing protein n=1 Tax=Kineothrix alysoides TaxID=1469948 RepID=A0A4V2QB07_9FIRM|nr:DUF1284 domain-containing protein [Kineothrix alysoides]TCL54602.1 hypothetical protein EDD76_11925 [Kineothrix alysoides]